MRRCVLSSASAKRRARICRLCVSTRQHRRLFRLDRRPWASMSLVDRDESISTRNEEENARPFFACRGETFFHPMQRSSHRRARARKSEARKSDRRDSRDFSRDRSTERTEESGRETKGNRASDGQRLLGCQLQRICSKLLMAVKYTTLR